MSNRLYIKNIGFALLALGFGFSSNPANAGFQWVAPSAPAAAPASEAPAPQAEAVTPVVTGEPQPLAPVTENTSPSPTIASPVSPPAALSPAPIAAMPTPLVSESPESSSPPPVVIEGTTQVPSAKSDFPSPVIIQGNGNSDTITMSASNGEPAPVASGESVQISAQTPVVSSQPVTTPVVTEAAPVIVPSGTVMPSAEAAASHSLALEPASAPAYPAVTLSSPGMTSSTGPSEVSRDAPPAPPPSLTPAPPPVSVPTSDVVHGFANHVPLAVALRQILPTGYGFSVDQSVDLGVLVSFHGGKSWQDTLDEALAPAGLVAHEKGQMVEISYPSGKESKDTVISDSTSSTNSISLSSGAAPSAQPRPVSSHQTMTMPLASDLSAVMPSPSPTQQAWDADPGDSLHKVLEDWSRRANVEFDWMAEYDYPLQASVHLKGSFEDAVRGLLTGFESAHPQPIAELHANPKVGQMVLVVTTRGNSAD